MRLIGSWLSDAGRVRKQNEDTLGFFPELGLFVVADGMGGHAGGKQASQIAVETLREQVAGPSGTPPDAPPAAQRLLDGLHEANRRIREAAAADPTIRGMGTTLVAIRFDEERATIAHVGDSRAYRLRPGKVEQLTHDHSLVGDLVRSGNLSESAARVHPYRHKLTQALGGSAEIVPDVENLEVQAGDSFILCSDGAYGFLEEGLFERILLEHAADPESLCREVIAAAEAAGGRDNASVIAILCAGDGL